MQPLTNIAVLGLHEEVALIYTATMLEALCTEVDNVATTLATSQLSVAAVALFRDGLSRTLRDNARLTKEGTVCVITGDIPAMWLRDSTFQVLPLLRCHRQLPSLVPFIQSLLATQCAAIQLDPYANAFNEAPTGSPWATDRTNQPLDARVWERKYELDSLCAPLHLAYQLYAVTGATAQFNAEFWQTVRTVLRVWRVEQDHTRSPYYFERRDAPATDTLNNAGRGTPVAVTGMIWSGFRPSDDACEYGYLIPANQFAHLVLEELQTLIVQELGPAVLMPSVTTMAKQVAQGLQRYGMATVNGRQIWAYEVDGLGHQLLMDDANVPSLLSLPYLGVCAEDEPIYLNTRAFVLSPANPYYYAGVALMGIGSPHTPRNRAWPIAIAMAGLTTTSAAVKRTQLERIAATDAGTGHVHESVDVDDPTQFTRTAFSWADMTYCALYFDYVATLANIKQ